MQLKEKKTKVSQWLKVLGEVRHETESKEENI